MTLGFTLTPEAVRQQAEAFREAPPESVLEWAVQTFPGRVGLTCSFSGPGIVLAHLLSKIDRTVPVIFLDTGFLFPETYELKERYRTEYGLNLVELKPLSDPGPLYETDTDQCCYIRKVEPMQRAVSELDGWITALRRDQSATRAEAEVLEYHEIDGRPLVKVLPLAHWDRTKTWTYILDNKLPYNPLLDQGYTSIGCWPCTRPVNAGEDERAGRWSGQAKTECGLHTFTTKR